MTVSDHIEINASTEEVWRQLADPTQMPRWSPENTGAFDGTTGAPLPVGATFAGSNKRGPARWTTQCVVTESEPGVTFGFDVVAIGLRKPRARARIAHWNYTLEPTPTGVRVTETWTDGRKGWPDWAAAVFDKVATRGSLFADFQRRNIAKTLANLRADLEK